MRLYTYWRSQASFRVRIALRLRDWSLKQFRSICSRATNSTQPIGRSIRRWLCRLCSTIISKESIGE
jgi:hypothetical protein